MSVLVIEQLLASGRSNCGGHLGRGLEFHLFSFEIPCCDPNIRSKRVLYRVGLYRELNGVLLQNKVFQPRAVKVRMKVVSKVSGSYCDLVLTANGHHRRGRFTRHVIRDTSI